MKQLFMPPPNPFPYKPKYPPGPFTLNIFPKYYNIPYTIINTPPPNFYVI